MVIVQRKETDGEAEVLEHRRLELKSRNDKLAKQVNALQQVAN